MTYLALIFATVLYFAVGAGGPLHRDDWFLALQRRVDAIEPNLWVGFLLMIVVPCLLLALLYALLDALFGGAAMLLMGTAALFFGFGRANFDGLTERFLARCDAGDYQGGALVIEEAGGEVEAEDDEEFGRIAARTFVYEGYQRWFPAVFYFLLLGPFWAVAYRLIQLAADDRRVPVGSLRHLVDWLPSRLLMLTIALAGNFGRTYRLLFDRAMDPQAATDDLLLEIVERSLGDGDNQPATQVRRVQDGLKRALVIWIVLISLSAILS